MTHQDLDAKNSSGQSDPSRVKKKSRRVDEYVKAKDIHSFDMMMFLVMFGFILKDLSPKLKNRMYLFARVLLDKSKIICAESQKERIVFPAFIFSDGFSC